MIATPRLILREFVEEDWTAVLSYQQDERYLRYYPWTERTEADARPFVQTFMAWQREVPRRRFQLAVTLKTAELYRKLRHQAQTGQRLGSGHRLRAGAGILGAGICH